MAEPVVVTGQVGDLAVILKIAMPSSHWWTQFLPTLPGVLVAVVGLYIAHRLTLRRERRKEVRDACGSLQAGVLSLADEAAQVWMQGHVSAPVGSVMALKAKLQGLGTKATSLKRQTEVDGWLLRLFGRSDVGVDVLLEVVALRAAVTEDPFEDPGRQPDASVAERIRSEANNLVGSIENHLARLQSSAWRKNGPAKPRS